MRVLILLLFLSPVYLHAQQAYWALVETNCADFSAARELRQQLVAEGHLISLIYQPQWLVARLQVSPATIKSRHPQILAVGAGPGGSRHLAAPATLVNFYEKMAAGRFDPAVKSKTGPLLQEDFLASSCVRMEPSEKGRTDEYPLVNDYNSEYFRGIVATSVLFIESDGSDDPNYYSWTQEALEEEKLDVLMALHTWAYTAYRHEADLTFVPLWFDSRPEVNQGFEPNLHLGSFDFYGYELGKMTGAVLHNLGYTEPYVGAQGNNFSYDQRQACHGDFGFTIGIHYSHNGKGYIRANAMIGGPITYLSREYDYRVYGHEIGHIFHAYDEYLNTENCDPSYASFNGVINGNNLANSCREKQTCVMNDNSVLGNADQIHFAVCSYTVAHFGWGTNDLAPAPHIRTQINTPLTTPFFELEADFPAFRDRLQGYVKIWQLRNENRDSLLIAQDLGSVAGPTRWSNTTSLAPGRYKCIFYHGQRGSYALVPSQPLLFEIKYTPVFSFRDTCLFFCQTPELIRLPQSDLRWYGDLALQQLLHEGSEYLPDFNTDSTIYVAQFTNEEVTDIARIRLLFGRPANVGIQSRIEGDGRIALSLYSFLPIPNVETIEWYKNGTPVVGAHDWYLYVEEPGAYSATIKAGCLVESDTFRLILPPVVEKTTLCDRLAYQLVAHGQNIQWYNAWRIPFSTEDTLLIEDVTQYYFFMVTQTIDGVESPLYEVVLTPLVEEQRIDLLNINGYLRVKSPYPTVDWWRNDTLFLANGPLEMTAPLPGAYRVSTDNPAGCRYFSNTEEIRFSVPPPTVPQDVFINCLKGRLDPDDFESPIARAIGQNLRWYYEPERFEPFNVGETYKISYIDFKTNARFFVTQTINGEESPPTVIATQVVFPIDLAIDSLGEVLHAVVNGVDKDVLPEDYIFQWYLNGEPLPNSDSEWFYPEGNGGWYTTGILNLTEGCLAGDSIFLNFSTPTTEVPLEANVLVFPNPADDLFYVQFEGSGEKRLLLYNSSGQLLRQLSTYDQLFEVNSASLPAGLYFIRCRLANGSETVRKVVKR